MYKFELKKQNKIKENLVISNILLYFTDRPNELHSFLIYFNSNIITELGCIYDLNEVPEDALVYRDLINYGDGAISLIVALNEINKISKSNPFLLLSNGVKTLTNSLNVEDDFDKKLLPSIAIEQCFTSIDDNSLKDKFNITEI